MINNLPPHASGDSPSRKGEIVLNLENMKFINNAQNQVILCIYNLIHIIPLDIISTNTDMVCALRIK